MNMNNINNLDLNNYIIFFEFAEYTQDFVKANIDLLPFILKAMRKTYTLNLPYKETRKDLTFVYIPNIIIESIRSEYEELHQSVSSLERLYFTQEYDCLLFESSLGYHRYIELINKRKLAPRHTYMVCFYLSTDCRLIYREVFYNTYSGLIENMTIKIDEYYINHIFKYKVAFTRQTLLRHRHDIDNLSIYYEPLYDYYR